jgi:mevalonate kinase
MPVFSAYTPGKVILFGEHAVVYQRPAIAVPVMQVRARAVVEPALRVPSGQVRVIAPDIHLDSLLDDLPAGHPFSAIIQVVLNAVAKPRLPACTLRVNSTIPVASGLGSGAAVAVACIRALSAFLGSPLPDERVCALAYEIERIHHGTPSGIDNTVVTYAQPVYFVRSQAIQLFKVGAPFTLVIGDTGIASPTAAAVGEVRQAWQASPQRFEEYFDAIGAIVCQARREIENGGAHALGALMDQNQSLLQQIGVSCAELDKLVDTARSAGAWGAKLSGGGRGGNMIAIVEPARAQFVVGALLSAGAKHALVTQVGGQANV